MIFLYIYLVVWILSLIGGLILEGYGEHNELENYSLEHGAMYAIPILGTLALCVGFFEMFEVKGKKDSAGISAYNILYKCRDCGIFSRFGYIILKEVEVGNKVCPHCESGTPCLTREDKMDVDIELPMSPKFTVKMVKELNELKEKKKYTDIVDEQYDKYLKLQKKKLKETLEKVGENK